MNDKIHLYHITKNQIPYYEILQRENMPISHLTAHIIIIVKNEIIGYSIMSNNKLDHLFVKEQFRGMGFGSKLLEESLAIMPHLELMVGKKNEAAIALYNKHGFVKNYCYKNYFSMSK